MTTPKSYAETWDLIRKLLSPEPPKDELPKVFQTEAEWRRHQNVLGG